MLHIVIKHEKNNKKHHQRDRYVYKKTRLRSFNYQSPQIMFQLASLPIKM